MRRLIFLVLIALVGCGSAAKPVPEFTFEDVRGEKIHKSDLLGKVVLIDFWASWCGPCLKAAPSLQNLHRELGSRGLVVLGVNINDPRSDAGSIRAYAETKKLTYRMALQGEQLAAELKVDSLPTLLVIDRQGRIRERIDGLPDNAERYLHNVIEPLLKE